MYAVFAGGCIVYLGDCEFEAKVAFDESVSPTMTTVRDLEDLDAQFADHVRREEDMRASEEELEAQEVEAGDEPDPLSTAVETVLSKLDGLGLSRENADELARTLKEGGGKAAAQVRSLGVKGMRAVGEGFVALGELLRKAEPEGKK